MISRYLLPSAIAILVVVILAFIFFFPRNQVTIAGTLDLNGQPPANSTISVLQSPHGQNQYSAVVANLPAADGTNWSWAGAKAGQNYDLKLSLLDASGKILLTTNPQTITAPASSISLRMNYIEPVSQTNTPNPSPTPSPSPAFISGTLDLNGYIPTGSTVTLQQQSVTGGNFQTFGTPFTAQDNDSWVWKEAVTNQQYNLRAVLQNSAGTQIGQSLPITVSAPAANEVITLNSSAVPPASQPTTSSGTISGTINLNGVVPSGASIVILATSPGSSDYQTVVSGISPTNGVTWSWNGATPGQSYQIVASLKNSSLNDIAVSAAATVSAPAANEVLTLNSNASLPAPANLPSITCNTKNQSTNSWSVTINYSSIPGAATYWLQLGSTSGGSDLINVTQGPSNNVYVTANATLNDSVTYYAQYAYSLSPDVAMGSNFSGFSPTQAVHCP